MKNLPERIYLNIGDEVSADVDFRELSEVTWSEEKVFDNDIAFTRKPQWISVEDELPEDDSYFYFVADVNKNPLAVDCAEYACETKKFSRGGQILHPTHWMHIPTPSLPDTNTEKI